MAYSKPVNNVDEPDSIRFGESCQVHFRVNGEALTIGERFIQAMKEAFGVDDKKLFAEKLGYGSDKVIYKIAAGEQELNFERPLKFKNSTKRSIDWLLTGEGEETIDPYAFLSEQEREAVEKLAVIEKKGLDDFLSELINYALARRAADLLSGYEQLKTKDRETLLAIYPLLVGEEAQVDILKPPNSTRR